MAQLLAFIRNAGSCALLHFKSTISPVLSHYSKTLRRRKTKTASMPRWKDAKLTNKIQKIKQARRRPRLQAMKEPVVVSKRTKSSSNKFAQLPAEIFYQVAANLPPLSLLSLSRTCHVFNDLLSFETGNMAWYTSLPAAALTLESASKELALLGGPYVPTFKYKREFIKHCLANRRCFLCLCLKDSEASEDHKVLWNIKLCSDCYEENTISKLYLYVPHPCAVLTAPAFASLCTLDIPASILTQLISSSISISGRLHYRPLVDTLLRVSTGRGLLDYELIHYTQRLQKKCMLLENSKVEQQRVHLRLRIVAAAERLWSGTDDHGSEIASCAIFSTFRARFAPTHLLRTFLFPACRLTSQPTKLSTPDQDSKTKRDWLDDPTISYRKQADFEISDAVVESMALRMLHNLVDFRSECKHLTGSNVATFIEAANEYHKSRIEAELMSGQTLQMEFFPPHLSTYNSKADPRRGLIKLRGDLGLRPLPLVPYDHDNYPATSEMAQEMRANKYFHKLAMESCRRCPYSTYIFFPVGIDGLLKHMRKDHPSTFWTGTFHYIG